MDRTPGGARSGSPVPCVIVTLGGCNPATSTAIHGQGSCAASARRSLLQELADVLAQLVLLARGVAVIVAQDLPFGVDPERARVAPHVVLLARDLAAHQDDRVSELAFI